MDTSHKYIEMCSRAVEIQEIRKIKFINGDMHYRPIYGVVLTLEISWLEDQEDPYDNYQRCTFLANDYKCNDSVWLPRQDQLQEIIFEEYLVKNIQIVHESFSLFLSTLSLPKLNSIDSFEKYWLMYVMQRKFNKIWDDNKKDWILINP